MTALFADLTGYTRLCADLDAEDVHLLVRPLMNALRQVCEGAGGVVPVIEGDGFMAIFGALVSDEDDPRRAVAAAVRMQELVEERQALATQLPLPALRIGINVGEALVAPSWEQTGFSVSGDVVNVASRLCGVAGEGAVLVSSVVADLAPGEGLWGPEQPQHLRNRDEPVLTRSLNRLRATSLGFARPVPSDAALVGRADLVEQVLDIVQEGRAVLLTGEPGIGKSRLLGAVADRRGGTVVRALCPRFPTTSTLGQVALQLLLEPACAGLGAGHRRALAAAAGRTSDSVEVDDNARQVEAVVAALGRMAVDGPTTLMLDDLQWAAAEDLALVELLAAGSDVGLLLASRADGAPVVRADRLDVSALRAEDAAALVCGLLPGATTHLVAALVERCGGVPLFVEQCVALLVDDGTVLATAGGWELARPQRLTSLPTGMRLFVASRIDLAPPHARETLGLASVVGHEVDVDLLAHLAGKDGLAESVEDLVARDLLRWRTTPGGTRLEFRHALVRDVAYESLLRRRRQQLHLVAAEWYGVLPVVQVLAQQAAHLEAALALGDADCGLVRRTVGAMVHYAVSISEERTSVATGVLRRAELLVAEHPQCEVDLLDLHLAVAMASEIRGDEVRAAEAATAAFDLCHPEDETHLALASLLRGRASVMAAPALAVTDLDRAQQLFERLGDLTGVARVVVERTKLGEVQLSRRWEAFELAFSAAVRAGDMRLASLAAQDLAVHLAERDPVDAERWSERASELLRADDVVGRARLDLAAARASFGRYDLPNMADAAETALASAQNAGALQLVMGAYALATIAMLEVGRLDRAEILLDEADAIAATRPTRRLAVDLAMHRALLLARQGRTRAGLALLDDVQPEVNAFGREFQRQHHALRGRLLLESGHFAVAGDQLREAVALAEQLDQQQVALVDRLHLLVARSATRQHVALRETSDLRAQARSSGAPLVGDLATLWLELGDVLNGHRDHPSDAPLPTGAPAVEALQYEVLALRSEDPSSLLRAAECWSRLGTTVWSARALTWYAEITGEGNGSATQVLAQLDAPHGLEEHFRSQVRSRPHLSQG